MCPVGLLAFACLLAGSSEALSAQAFRQDEWNKLMLAGRLAADTRRYADADQMFLSAVQQLEEARIEGGLIARPLYELAAVRAFTGRHADASRLLMRAIAILEASPKPDPSELAVGWQGLGTAYLNIPAILPTRRKPFRKLWI